MRPLHPLSAPPLWLVRGLCLVAWVLSSAVVALAQAPDLEIAVRDRVARVVVEMPTAQALRAADERRATLGRAPHFAAPLPLDSALWDDFTWDLASPRTARARLLVEVPGALSLSLAFARVELPAGAHLRVIGASRALHYGPPDVGETLWTPPLEGDRVLIEATVPFTRLDEFRLDLDRAHGGYVALGPVFSLSSEPSCQVDLACLEDSFDDPERPAGTSRFQGTQRDETRLGGTPLDTMSALQGTAWSQMARSVGRVTIDGVRFCTGFLVGNTRGDRRPLFVTARHCGITVRNAASVVVEWGVRHAECGGGTVPAGPSPVRAGMSGATVQNGSTVRAIHPATDLVLLELDQPPPADAVWAGWDRSDRPPRRTAVLHHPRADRQRISVDFDLPSIAGHLERAALGPTRGTDHLRIDAWELGSTEGGSSGAPLFDTDGRALGWLRGGYAACGVAEPDWFGRLAAAWDGPSPDRRLRDWLDPLDTQALVLDPLGVESAVPGAALADRLAPR